MKKLPNHRLNLLVGSVRSGKTVTCNHYFPLGLSKAPTNGDIFLIGKTLGSLERNVINPLQKALGDDFSFQRHKSQAQLWGKTIFCFGASDEQAKDAIQGSTCAFAYGDEVPLWPESFFKMLDSRLSCTGSLFIGTANADSPHHYLKKDYIDRRHDGVDFCVYNFYLTDNSKAKGGFLDDNYIKAITTNYTGLWYKRLIENKWCAADGAIYDFFDEDTHVISHAPVVPDWFDVSIDYGTNNPTVFLLHGTTTRQIRPSTWVDDEYYYDSEKEMRQKTDSEYAHDLLYFLAPYTSSIDPIIEYRFGMNELLRVKGERKKDVPLVNIILDPSAASFYLELSRWGFTGLQDADNDVLDGIRTTSRLLKNRQVAICQRCTHLIEEIQGYVWDKKAQLLGIDKPVKKKDHGPDALRYKLQTTFGKLEYN